MTPTQVEAQKYSEHKIPWINPASTKGEKK